MDKERGNIMEFLKSILGDELFAQVQEKINAHNGDEANKDKQIKLANLSAGGYVSKDKFNAKESELATKLSELSSANELITELKKSVEGDESLKGKITDYETQVQALQNELAQTRIRSAIKVALMSEKALDVDYLTFKLNEKLAESGEPLELDDNGNIKGWKDKIETLKIQFPTQFETGSSGRKIEEHKLDKPEDGSGGYTKKDILKMPYAERNAFAQENPEAYAQAMGR